MKTKILKDTQMRLIVRNEFGVTSWPDWGALGDQVSDDWQAAESWLGEVQAKNGNASTKTVETYRFHLAKLRWYCDHVAGNMPSSWTVQDVAKFREFLRAIPRHALCSKKPAIDKRTAAGTMRPVNKGEPGWTPFRVQPSANTQGDILRCLHALFSAWHHAGCIRFHPMALSGAPKPKAVNVSRAIPLDLYDLVLEQIKLQEITCRTDHQLAVRDRFIFLALRWLGLRSSELVQASMGAFQQVTMPRTGQRYWIFNVRAETAKGGIERNLPVIKPLFDALIDYRVAFNLTPTPSPNDPTSLLLSIMTGPIYIGTRPVLETSSRRFFGAWRCIKTRQGLSTIVKGRLGDAATKLRKAGNIHDAELLEQASSHWLRHTFGKAALLAGQQTREVMAAMGHSNEQTLARYTVQDALDLIKAWEREQPGCVASEHPGQL